VLNVEHSRELRLLASVPGYVLAACPVVTASLIAWPTRPTPAWQSINDGNGARPGGSTIIPRNTGCPAPGYDRTLD